MTWAGFWIELAAILAIATTVALAADWLTWQHEQRQRRQEREITRAIGQYGYGKVRP